MGHRGLRAVLLVDCPGGGGSSGCGEGSVSPSSTSILHEGLNYVHGLALAVQSWGALLVLLGVFSISYGYRMRVEEKALLSQLGEDYASYLKRTKRLIPYII